MSVSRKSLRVCGNDNTWAWSTVTIFTPRSLELRRSRQSRSLLRDHRQSRTQLVGSDVDSALRKRFDCLLFGGHLRSLDLLSYCVGHVPDSLFGLKGFACQDVVGFVVLSERSCVVVDTQKHVD